MLTGAPSTSQSTNRSPTLRVVDEPLARPVVAFMAERFFEEQLHPVHELVAVVVGGQSRARRRTPFGARNVPKPIEPLFGTVTVPARPVTRAMRPRMRRRCLGPSRGRRPDRGASRPGLATTESIGVERNSIARQRIWRRLQRRTDSRAVIPHRQQERVVGEAVGRAAESVRWCARRGRGDTTAPRSRGTRQRSDAVLPPRLQDGHQNRRSPAIYGSRACVSPAFAARARGGSGQIRAAGVGDAWGRSAR